MLGGSSAIVSGVMATHWGLQGAFDGGGWAKARNHLVASSGIVLLLIGWVIALISFGIDTPSVGGDHTSSIVNIVMGVTIIVGAAILMKQRLKMQNDIGWLSVGLILFIGGWLTEASFLSMDTGSVHSFNGTKAAFNYPAAAAIITSMLWFEPWQHKHAEPDGPAYGLLAMGWALLSIGHSIQA